MANEFLTTKNIARQILPRLIENLVMPNLCYKDFANEFAKQGDTIRVRKPVVLEAKSFTAGTPVNEQDVKEESIDVKLDKIATVDVNFEAIQMATNVDDLNRLVIEPAAVALAQKINGDGLAMYVDIPYHAGTAGSTPAALSDFAAARKALNKKDVPLSGRRAIWDVDADAAFTQIGNLVKVSESGSPSALREGEIGRVYAIDNYMSQAVKKHTVGATGTVLVDKADGYAAGATQIHVDGLTAAFKVGDLFTIANDTTQYVVTKAGALDTADQDIDIYPALAVNTANNAAITVIGTHVANLVFHENAFAFVTRPLIAPSDKESYTTSYNGLSLRVVRGYDMAYKREKMSVDILYGYKTVYPEMAIRYLG